MQVTCISGIDEFDRLKAAWDAVYAADCHAQVFLSWDWLRGWLEATASEWFVLAARADSDGGYAAFLPLGRRALRKRRCRTEWELYMAGSPLADYTGFLCLPGCEQEAIPALADHVEKQLEWDRLDLKDVLDPRLDLFLRHISPEKCAVEQVGSTVCPYVELPGTWEQYLQTLVGPKSRREFRRCLGRIERGEPLRLTHLTGASGDLHIEVLLRLWQLRWSARPAEMLEMLRRVLRSCAGRNCLWLPVLWHAETPIAAAAVLIDHQKKVFNGYIMAFDATYAKLSPGTTLIAYTLRHAIEHGFKTFDFLRGGEDYKDRFGTQERRVTHTTITRMKPQPAEAGRIRQLRRRLNRIWSRA